MTDEYETFSVYQFKIDALNNKAIAYDPATKLYLHNNDEKIISVVLTGDLERIVANWKNEHKRQDGWFI